MLELVGHVGRVGDGIPSDNIEYIYIYRYVYIANPAMHNFTFIQLASIEIPADVEPNDQRTVAPRPPL